LATAEPAPEAAERQTKTAENLLASQLYCCCCCDLETYRIVWNSSVFQHPFDNIRRFDIEQRFAESSDRRQSALFG